ncbi:MAG: OmpH family outer membrane protein [Proteobacteria bacterium]|jgi:Skp family chaperone for outer membrane proteins|nr:OmpH family outer membrane protein [Pseudomonadota bacterium]
MKHIITLICLGFLVYAPAVSADPLPAPKILIVDLESLSQKSLATRDLNAKVDAAIAASEQAMRFKYEALQDELYAFQVEAAGLPARERSDRDNAIRRRMAELDAEEQAATAKIEQRAVATMAGLQSEFRAVTATIADGLEADMVLNKTVYDALTRDGVLAQAAEDITTVVLAFLNGRLPNSGFSTDGGIP